MLIFIYRKVGITMKLNIKKKLEENNMSRYELAKRIGVTYPTIDNIYKGKSTSIKLEIFEWICKELKWSPIEILESDDPQMKRILAYGKAFSSMNKKDDTK